MRQLIFNKNMYINNFPIDINVMIQKASAFPEGVKAAHKKLHTLITNNKTSRYFGISYMGKNNEIIYYAAAEILNADDAVNFGLETFTIKIGNY